MKSHPQRLFLDTNVFVVGAAFADSPEAAILDWAGFSSQRRADVVILVSDALFQQIARVARRLRGKDWAGQILERVWRNMIVDYVPLRDAEIRCLTPAQFVVTYLTPPAMAGS